MPPSGLVMLYISSGLKEVKNGTAEGLTLSVWLKTGNCTKGKFLVLNDVQVRLEVYCNPGELRQAYLCCQMFPFHPQGRNWVHL